MKYFSIFMSSVILCHVSLPAIAAREDSVQDGPSTNRYDHSKYLGYMVLDKGGNPYCGATSKGSVSSLTVCDAQTAQMAEAQIPKGASAVKTAALPLVLVGAAVACFAGGVISGSALLEQNPQTKNLKLIASRGISIVAGSPMWLKMTQFLIQAGNANDIFGFGTVVSGSVAMATVATVAVCAASGYGGRQTYYFFTRSPADIQKQRQ